MRSKDQTQALQAPAHGSATDAPFLNALSPVMKGVEAIVAELAHSHVPVLLIGECGTGKRTVAHRIHSGSGQLPSEFRILSCSELVPATLAEILGPVGTTVYLEEIGDLSPTCQ